VRRIALISLLICGLAAQAASASFVPKRAYFRMSVTATQTTTLHVTSQCTDANGNEVTRTGDATETLRLKTQQPGRVLFKTDSHGRIIVFQEDASFETGVRPARTRGTVERTSTLDDRRGTTAQDCGYGEPATGCGTRSFSRWRVSLFGRGRNLKVGLRNTGLAGGNLFPHCPLQSQKSATLDAGRPALLPKREIYNLRHDTLGVTGSITRPLLLEDALTNSTGTAEIKLTFKVRLARAH
jgi:hypothetical protein